MFLASYGVYVFGQSLSLRTNMAVHMKKPELSLYEETVLKLEPVLSLTQEIKGYEEGKTIV